MNFEDLEEILIHCDSFSWEEVNFNLNYAADTIGRLKFVEKVELFLDDIDDGEVEGIDDNVIDLLGDVVEYRHQLKEFRDNYVDEGSPYGISLEDDYVREVSDILTELADDIIRFLSIIE